MDPPEENPPKRVKFDIRPERRRQAPAGQRQEQKLDILLEYPGAPAAGPSSDPSSGPSSVPVTWPRKNC